MCQCSKNLIRSPALTLVNSILRLMFFYESEYVLCSAEPAGRLVRSALCQEQCVII